jgi:hypothetical protein
MKQRCPEESTFKKKDYKVFESNYIHFKRKPIIIKQCIAVLLAFLRHLR